MQKVLGKEDTGMERKVRGNWKSGGLDGEGERED